MKEIDTTANNMKEIDKIIEFIDEGINACKEDSKKEDCKGNELYYIFGKSQALKLLKIFIGNLYKI